jgi:hypothetical protein
VRACDYHFNELGKWRITLSRRIFRDGVGALRNLRQWAAEKRIEFIEDANLTAIGKRAREGVSRAPAEK